MLKLRGFTLIELLVVIAIIAVLMAILMPSLRAARDHAKRIHCVSNVKTLSLAWFMYKDENDDKLVGGHTNPGNWVLRPRDNATIEEKKDAIRNGALFPYVNNTVDVYRCPADFRIKDPGQFAFRSFSIPGGANGENWSGAVRATKYSDLKRPATRYVFLEDIDPRGYNVGSWVMNFNPPRWVDPLAMWHKERGTLGFADGHAEMHRWNDRSFIVWCQRAMFEPRRFSFNMTPPADERQDIEYMARGYPCKSHD
jgi:prepilin-type N-terminal cleavage/methylation domain-containing protein/prepilin-type processing-associated H-X9-DG protein